MDSLTVLMQVFYTRMWKTPFFFKNRKKFVCFSRNLLWRRLKTSVEISILQAHIDFIPFISVKNCTNCRYNAAFSPTAPPAPPRNCQMEIKHQHGSCNFWGGVGGGGDAILERIKMYETPRPAVVFFNKKRVKIRLWKTHILIGKRRPTSV